MRRIALAILCCAASLAVAQVDSVPATTRVEHKSRTWTNDDLEKLTGSVNVLGNGNPATTPGKSPTRTAQKDPDACESDAWVIAVIGVLREQGVTFGPRFWPERLFGDTCINNVAVNAVASRIEGDYTLDNGTKVHLTATVFPGLPTAPEIVNSVGENHPLIIQWKGQPLVMTKVDYVDRQHDYVSTYSIADLLLTNVLTGRVLIFDAKTNSEKEIEGTLQVKVTPRR